MYVVECNEKWVGSEYEYDVCFIRSVHITKELAVKAKEKYDAENKTASYRVVEMEEGDECEFPII